MSRYLFLVASARESGQPGNTEWLARRAALSLPSTARQTWLHLSRMSLPLFVDQRHTVGSYPMPEGDLRTLLDATMGCTDLVLVTPVYWFAFPAPLKIFLDHWSAWLRVPGLGFKDAMMNKRMHVIATSGDRAKAQPMFDSARLCAQFLGMPAPNELWGKGGAPNTVMSDVGATDSADQFFASEPGSARPLSDK